MLSEVYCVRQVVKTPTIISSNLVYVYTLCIFNSKYNTHTQPVVSQGFVQGY